jgi:hypothetical protein
MFDFLGSENDTFYGTEGVDTSSSLGMQQELISFTSQPYYVYSFGSL